MFLQSNRFKQYGMMSFLVILLIIASGFSYNWEILTVPSPGANGSFQDIVALSDNDIWTVGFFRDPNTTGKAGDVSFAMHFDGNSWQIFDLPQFGYMNDNLYSVTASSPTDVWAVGSFDDNLRRRFPLLLHWDGSSWTRVDLGNASGNLYSVEAISPTEVWAVGEGLGPGAPGANITNLVLRYDGSNWQGVEIPSPGNRTNRLTDVHGSSPNDVWLVGYYRYSAGLYTSIIFHWDGSNWSVANNPNPSFQNFLYAAFSFSPDNFYAMGRHDAQAVVQHWDGASWNLIDIPGISKFDMDAADPNNIWGTGYDIVHWDGNTWQAEFINGLTNMNLRGVDVVSANSVWAAGGSSEFPYLVVHRTETGPPPNIPPVAVASADVTSGPAPLTVNFSSTGSHDPDGSIVSYHWDFGDGNSSTEANPTHTYTNNTHYPIRYHITLTVTDDGGATDQATLFVDVGPIQNQNPVAVASADVTSGPAPLTVNFSSAGSYDPDGSIVQYHWNFGDGNVSLDPNPSHTYTTPGTYPVVLTVTDDLGAFGSDLMEIVVTSGTANPTVHVAAQQVYRVKIGRRKWRAEDRVLILDNNGNPVSGAMVFASYTGPNNGNTRASTDNNGVAVLQTRTYRSKNSPPGQWCFEITNVQADGYDYDPQQNVVTTQCENGTITKSDELEDPSTQGVAASEKESLRIFPNPFNPETNIQIYLPHSETVTLRVYDISGRQVRVITNEELLPAGTHTFRWAGVTDNRASLPSGIYFLQVKIGQQMQVRKLQLIK